MTVKKVKSVKKGEEKEWKEVFGKNKQEVDEETKKNAEERYKKVTGKGSFVRLFLSKNVHRKFRLMAAAENTSMADLAARLITDAVKSVEVRVSMKAVSESIDQKESE